MDSIKKLVDLFAKFPTVGSRTALRFVFYLLRLPKEKINELASTILQLADKVKLCAFCFNPHENSHNLCAICQNTLRDRKIICIVEKEADLMSIEKTKKYNGLYFVLGGVLNLVKNNSDQVRMKELIEKIKDPQKFGLHNTGFTEIIIALNPTPEGRSTSVLVEKTLKEMQFNSLKISHLAKGLPFGGGLEYADE